MGVGLGMAVLLLSLSCGRKEASKPEPVPEKGKEKSWNRAVAEKEYRLIQTELKLVKTGKPYFVLDFKRGKLELRLKGTIVWAYPIDPAESDASDVVGFQKRFQGDGNRLIRPITGKYLFAAKGQTSDSVLGIVGRAMRVDPAKLQRELPQRFQLRWENDLILDIQTNIAGTPISKFDNVMVEIGQVLNRPFGESILAVKIKPEEGLTLYRAAEVGMPTLICLPAR